MWPPGLSLGQQALCLKFLSSCTSLFEHAAKSKEGMIVALIERDDIGG